MRALTVLGLGTAPAGGSVVVTVTTPLISRSLTLPSGEFNSRAGWRAVASLLGTFVDHCDVMFNTAVLIHDFDDLASLELKVEVKTTTGTLVSATSRTAGSWVDTNLHTNQGVLTITRDALKALLSGMKEHNELRKR